MNENRAKPSRRNDSRIIRISKVQPARVGHFEAPPEEWSVYEFPGYCTAPIPLGTQFLAWWQSATHWLGYVWP
jgi:hypothetical protein